jgi:3-hydroxymyristoyl/3-hydroxydecanoyl-(acyl carrier protein) dehydratase
LTTIKQQIEEYLQSGTSDDGRPMGEYRFPAGFLGFQGHFPDRSILPGACQIQCLLTLLERLSGKALALREIVLAKYTTPVFPDEVIRCVLGETPDFSGPVTLVKALVYREGERVSELRLRVSPRETPES